MKYDFINICHEVFRYPIQDINYDYMFSFTIILN